MLSSDELLRMLGENWDCIRAEAATCRFPSPWEWWNNQGRGRDLSRLCLVRYIKAVVREWPNREVYFSCSGFILYNLCSSRQGDYSKLHFNRFTTWFSPPAAQVSALLTASRSLRPGQMGSGERLARGLGRGGGRTGSIGQDLECLSQWGLPACKSLSLSDPHLPRRDLQLLQTGWTAAPSPLSLLLPVRHIQARFLHSRLSCSSGSQVWRAVGGKLPSKSRR